MEKLRSISVLVNIRVLSDVDTDEDSEDMEEIVLEIEIKQEIFVIDGK